MSNRNTLYIYNICYKLPIKICKYELDKIITRHEKYEKLKMQKNMPGQAFVRFKNISSANKCLKILNGYFFIDRKFKCRFADNDMIIESPSLSLFVTDVDENMFYEFNMFFKECRGFKDLRVIKPKKVIFIDFGNLKDSRMAKISFEKKFRKYKISYSKA